MSQMPLVRGLIAPICPRGRNGNSTRSSIPWRLPFPGAAAAINSLPIGVLLSSLESWSSRRRGRSGSRGRALLLPRAHQVVARDREQCRGPADLELVFEELFRVARAHG